MVLRLLMIGLGASVLAGLGGAARGDDVTAVRFGEHPDMTRIVVETSTPVQMRVMTLAEPTERLVLELPRGAR